MSKPKGNAKAMAINVVRMVPLMSAIMPKCLSANNGVHCVSVKKSKMDTSSKNATISYINMAMMLTVVNILTEAHKNSAPSIIFSFMFLLNIKCKTYMVIVINDVIVPK